MLIHDIYCLFNRLRGVASLISPNDLREALEICTQNEEYPVKLTRIGGSVEDMDSDVGGRRGKQQFSDDSFLVVQLKSFSGDALGEKILKIIDESEEKRVSAQQVSHKLNIGLTMASLQLKQNEMISGKLCRDDSIQGLFFYRNFFLGV